ncbi:hypothetical protein JMJ35_004245 [Cladonia borealis]|uniref:Uncharacterized protein n=1 Tax=Cladonia borealis TaxID=184061 RepID=A0AA39R422_9LECA|nr:hypothetical protein JMJ35_004245 [Cladonia borealis]
MAAAASSNIDAFPTSAFAALSSDQAAFTAALASTEYGCPERELTIFQSDLLSLGFDCLATSNIPLCVATAITDVEASFTVDYNAACCTSISIWGQSVESCLEKSAPPCLDTSALLASATAPGGAYATESNPCAPYWNGGKGAGPVQTPGPSTKGGSPKAGSVAATGTATGTSSGGSTSATKASAATKTGAGLKVYLGLGLVGALAVLTM